MLDVKYSFILKVWNPNTDQGADLSLLSAVKETYPTAATWFDLEVALSRPPSWPSHATLALLASSSAYMGGTCFSADNIDVTEATTSERYPRLLPLLSTDENQSLHAPQGMVFFL